jgi:hypothetical protein
MGLTTILLRIMRLLNGAIARLTPHTRTLQGVAALIALMLGFWGWTIKSPPADVGDHFDNLFRTIQLITLQFPGRADGGIPWQLHVARLAVPAVAAIATFTVLVGAITRPVRLALLPNMRGHLVVWGEAQLPQSTLKKLANRGVQVVLLSEKISNGKRDKLEGLGLTVIQSDVTDENTIKALNLPSAGAIFLAEERDLDNLNLAAQIIEAAGKRAPSEKPLLMAVSIANETLARELDLTLDGLARQHGVRYHRISAAREGLRLELDRFAPALIKTDPAERTHLLVYGLSGQWQQTLRQIFMSIQDHPERKPLVSLLLTEEERLLFLDWLAETPEWQLVIDWRVINSDGKPVANGAEMKLKASRGQDKARGLKLSADDNKAPAPQLALVLKPDDEALAAMLAMRRPGNPYATEQSVILVHQTREDSFLAKLSAASLEDRNLADVVAFGASIRPETVLRVLDRRGESIAIAMHAHYTLKQAGMAHGHPSPAALLAWDQLPENMREANRSAAHHAAVLFAAAGCQIAPAAKGDEAAPATFTAAELEILARVEHRRWIADRLDKGWRHGEKRDDRLRRHPSIVPYEALAPAEQAKDKASVEALVKILGDSGMVVRRRPPKAA